MKDTRRFSRIACDEIVIVETSKVSVFASILEISLKGALVRLPESALIESGERCWIAWRFEDFDLFLYFEGEVSLRRNKLAGVRFTDMDLDTLMHLRNLLERRSGDSLKISEEVPSLADYT